MNGCKYCTEENSWEIHHLGNEDALSVDLGVNTLVSGRSLMEIEIRYKGAGMDAMFVPVDFCPFCGRRLTDA